MSLNRILWLGIGYLLCSAAQPACAQVLRREKESPPPAEGKDKDKSKDEAAAENVREFRFQAAAEITPADRYQFWVLPIRRTEPGNAVAHILRANVMLHEMQIAQ